MKIALLGPANTIHYQRWAYALAARGHEVHVISQHPDEAIATSPVFASTTWLPFQGAYGYVCNVPALRKALRNIHPDIVNTHYASGYGLSSSMSTKCPTLLSVWGSDVYDFPYESWLKGRVLKRNLQRATAIASTSHTMARQVSQLVPDISPAYITPFGVDCSIFSPQDRQQLPSLTIGIVKTLAPKYGVDVLIRAFAHLLKVPSIQHMVADIPLKLLIVGDGPDREKLHNLACALGLREHVKFAGHIAHENIPSWLHQIDIFAAPSLDSESFGVAIVEASACGLPVVVSDAGGLPEVVENGKTGLVVAKNNVPALVDALEKLVLDKDLRKTMGQEGRQRVLKLYEWNQCVDQMLACYQKVIDADEAEHGI